MSPVYLTIIHVYYFPDSCHLWVASLCLSCGTRRGEPYISV